MPDIVNKPNAAGLYLHIPFCKQACVYCNFHFSTSLKYKRELLEAMQRELEMHSNFLKEKTIETIYFGGGTPSLLTADELNRLFDTIYHNYSVADLRECTLEANPDDLTKSYLDSLRKTPISRFSIGIQSFHERDLLYMKRAHNAAQADYSIKAAQDAGFSNLSIDLIYGVPGMSNEDWKQNMNTVAKLSIPHFSAYALTVEERTALHHAITKQTAAPVDSVQAAEQFELLMEYAANKGYEHYEISNLAKPGYYAIHNTNYWRGLPYLGIGPSAHSFDGGNIRRWNIANNALYTSGILKNEQALYEQETLSPTEHLNEYIMTSLRTQWGCDLKHIENRWGIEIAQRVDKDSGAFIQSGKLSRKGNKLLLTNSGKLFADGIAGDLFQ